MMRNAFLVGLNAIIQKPVVRNNEIVIANVACVNFVIDHRFIDGAQAKPIMDSVRKSFYYHD
jgi:pyruvate/2-oxoglutarate dehydrogenase complex dihydrolipoamide acyltransferase (E2) component